MIKEVICSGMFIAIFIQQCETFIYQRYQSVINFLLCVKFRSQVCCPQQGLFERHIPLHIGYILKQVGLHELCNCSIIIIVCFLTFFYNISQVIQGACIHINPLAIKIAAVDRILVIIRKLIGRRTLCPVLRPKATQYLIWIAKDISSINLRRWQNQINRCCGWAIRINIHVKKIFLAGACDQQPAGQNYLYYILFFHLFIFYFFSQMEFAK